MADHIGYEIASPKIEKRKATKIDKPPRARSRSRRARSTTRSTSGLCRWISVHRAATMRKKLIAIQEISSGFSAIEDRGYRGQTNFEGRVCRVLELRRRTLNNAT